MIMKKNLFVLGVMAIASLTILTNCAKTDVENPNEITVKEGTPFEFVAKTVQTRTQNDGLSTNWKADDGVNVFHRENGTTGSFGTNDQFTITSANLASDRFTGTLTEALEDGKYYDWYALYPYSASYTTPANTTYSASIGGTSKTQSGYGNRAHLAGTTMPMVGKAENVAKGSTPSISFTHIASVAKIIVTNNSGEPLTITSVTFTAPENIVGSFKIDFSDPDNVAISDGAYTTSNVAELKVTGGTALADGASATFYIAVKPFDLAKDDELTIKVNTYSKTVSMPKAFSFVAGEAKTINFNYDKTFTSENFYLASSITAGDKVIFTNTTTGTPKVMGHYSSGNNIPYVDGAFTIGHIASTAAMGVYTVGGDAVNGYTFYDSENELYLNATNTTSNNYLKGISPVDDYAKWAVSIDGAATITNKGKDDRNVIKYNTSNKIFAAYASSYTVNVDPIYIYKYDARTPLTSYAFASASVTKTPEEATSYSGLTVSADPDVAGTTYAMTGDDIGSVNASTGALTLTGDEGTAVVTATFAGDATYAPATASYTVTVRGKSITLTASTTNMPSSYGTANAFTKYSLEGYDFQIQQITKSGAKLQLRAFGNTNGTGTIYNDGTFPGNIKKITITYNSSDTKKNCTVYIGSSKNPSTQAITPTSDELVYTFDCSAYSYDYFVLANGTTVGYIDSIKIEWK